MTAYPENTGGIIAAINACIVAAGGQMGTYNNNTGGIIQALLELQTAIGGMGGGSAVEIELTQVSVCIHVCGIQKCVTSYHKCYRAWKLLASLWNNHSRHLQECDDSRMIGAHACFFARLG